MIRANLVVAAALAVLMPASASAVQCVYFGDAPGASVTIDGTFSPGEWDMAIESGTSAATTADPSVLPCLNATLPTQDVTLRTMRDANALYLAFEVADATDPESASAVADRIYVQISQNRFTDNTAALQTQHHRLYLINRRNTADVCATAPANLQTRAQWQNAAAGAWPGGTETCLVASPSGGLSATLADGVEVGVQNLSGPNRYTAEVRIPLTAIGLTIADTLTQEALLAVATVDDLGTQDMTTGLWELTGSYYPVSLAVTTTSNPVGDLFGTWGVPSNWGPGVFRARDIVTISREPKSWRSQDIRVANCDITAWADASRTGGNWWEYYPAGPCSMNMFARYRRLGTGLGGDLEYRALFVYGARGINPTRWHHIELTAPFTVPASAASITGAGPIELPPELWDDVPDFMELVADGLAANYSDAKHPCVRVYLIPETALQDNPAILTQLNTTGSEFTNSEFSTITNTLGISEVHHWAQMNLSIASGALVPIGGGTRTDPGPRPTCPIAGCAQSDEQDALHSQEFAPSRRFGFEASPPSNGTGSGAIGGSPSFAFEMVRVREAEPPQVARRPITNYADILITANGYVPPAGPQNFVFVEELGGFGELVDLDRLQPGALWPIPFRVSNHADANRRVTLVLTVEGPGAGRVNVQLDPGPYDLQPGETRVIVAQVEREASGPALSFHAGVTVPTGSFGTSVDPGPSVRVDLEVPLPNNVLSLELIGGLHKFDDLDVFEGSLNVKRYLPLGTLQAFINAGGGVYRLDPGSAKAGVNAGGGLQFNPLSAVIFEALANYHRINTSGQTTEMVSAQVGLRWRP